MYYRCIAIDDELPALELIKNYVARMPELQLMQTFNDAVSAGEFLRNTNIDLMFVDINMPDINGIDLVTSLKEKPAVIFTTAYKKFAYNGFELDAIDYLLKPIEFERFKKGVTKAIELFQSRLLTKENKPEFLFVRSEYKMLKIELGDVEFIEGLEDYIKITFSAGKPVLTLMTMKGILEKLPQDKFLRIHRSYIVSLNKISTVMNKKVLLKSGALLPVSDTYLHELNTWMNK